MKKSIELWLKRFKFAAKAPLTSPRVQLAVDRSLLSLLPKKSNGPRERHILIAAPGGGNIGDQAMVEAFIENTEGPIDIIAGNSNQVTVPASAANRVRVVPLKSLIYGQLPSRIKDSLAYRKLLLQACSVAVVGADIMDGGYNWRASANRANAALLAHKMGVPARILGFSWKEKADPRATSSVRTASAAGVKLFLRDPVSADRARKDGLQNVILTADTVFAAKTVDSGIVASLLPSDFQGVPLALVNASGLLQKAVSQLDEYLIIIRHLRSRGLKVVLLPHVSRPGADDLPLCRQIHDTLADSGTFLVDHLLQPAQIRGLTASATVVVTGRMHLAIMSLYNAVPAITLTSQGKVEGLMQMFQQEDLCVVPDQGFAAKVTAVADTLIDNRTALRQQLTQGAEKAKALAALNFADPA